jgi:hypothetical protein
MTLSSLLTLWLPSGAITATVQPILNTVKRFSNAVKLWKRAKLSETLENIIASFHPGNKCLW